MSTQELVSIIVPVYNIEQYLPRCIETISRQTYCNLEIILVDDGSTDNSGTICDSLAHKDNRIIVIHQNNMGLWAARNAGQRIAKGDYLMYVDGDDYMHLDAVKTLYDAINYSRKYDIAIIDYKITTRLDEDIISTKKGTVQEFSQETLISNLFNYRNNRDVWNKLYRKSLIENIFANDYSRSQGFDFNIRVYLKASCAVVIHCEMYFWVQRPTSLMHKQDYWDLLYKCHVRMFYENYVNLPSDKIQYGYLLLSKLYKEMVFLKNRNYRTNNEIAVFEQCKKYENNTRKAYWLNWHINPIEKIVVTILLHSPRLTRWLMKVTKNY